MMAESICVKVDWSALRLAEVDGGLVLSESLEKERVWMIAQIK
jgi:hypothetical protein